MDSSDGIDMKSCRICLSNKKPLCPLFRYKLSGNYAEMLTAIADVKVASNDGLPDRICQKCCTALEKAYLLKTVAERTDRKLRKILVKSQQNVPTKKIAFDSFTDIKSEIGPLNVKSEPTWELEVDLDNPKKPVETIDGKNIVIANTVIRKVAGSDDVRKKKDSESPDVTWKPKKSENNYDAEYLDDDVFQDDDDDTDYVPPAEKTKTKFKKPKLQEVKVFKGKKTVIRKVKVLTAMKDDGNDKSKSGKPTRATTITCYPIMKNGARGPPILLKRPKDATVLKVHPNYQSKTSTSSSAAGTKVVNREKTVRVVRAARPIMKQKEKLVCPVCGILTYTLGTHVATHEEKKKYTCPQCPRTFAHKSNMQIHMKQHTGIKDYICDICGAGFYSQKSLVRHNLIHKGERPFACDLCTKKFIAAQALRRHMRIHTGDKRFVCDICSKGFTQSHHLQNHTLTHTGDKPFNCEVCNVAFSYKVNLNNHVYKVHGVNLKFKSIHVVTEDILRRELGMANETRMAIMQIESQLADNPPSQLLAAPRLPEDAPPPAAHETIHHTDYN